ncbi:MAG TPA: ABC transporter permease [Blastocatellia bacterium]|nr:ABC transporter permease [Blastocatellia bacterium]
MKKIFVIIRREYLVRVRTRAFLLSTIASPILLLAFIVVPTLLIIRGGGDRQVIVLDQSGDPALFNLIQEKAKTAPQESDYATTGGPRPVETRFALTQTVVPPDKDIDELKRQYNSEVEKDSDKAYVVLRQGILDGVEPEYYGKNVSDFGIKDLERAINTAVIQRRLMLAGFDEEKVLKYMKQVEMKTFRVSASGESEQSGFQLFQVAFAMLFFIYVTVLAYGISVMRGVIEEKQSRIVEVIVSSVKPVQMMLAKLIGIGLVGLTQYVIWVLAAVLIAVSGAAFFATNGIALPNVPVSLLIYFVVFFVLGYFLYATLYAMVGAIVSSEEEAQHVQFPVMILIVVPMLLFGMVMRNPNSAMSIVLSLIPFFTPTLMMLRIAVINPPLWQIVLSMVLMVLTILGAVWVAARIYRVGILMYGKRPSLAELGRWLRYA